PGFLGRYKEGIDPNRIFPPSSKMYTFGNSITTIQGCIQTCRDNSKPIAVLASADECYCGDDDIDYQQYGEAVPGEMINEYVFYGTQQCSGDTGTEPYIQGCGGDYQLDVYDTTIGACGGQFTGHSGYIYSPNFPGKYPRDQNCIWTITVEDNHIIQISILMYKISTGDYLDIRDGDDVTAPKITWDSMNVYSTGYVVWLQFYSNSETNTDLGFALTYKALPQCSKPQPSYSNVITTPSPLHNHSNPGDSITFRCTTGYILNGVSVITCQDNGQWNSSVPTCTALPQCSKPQPVYSHVITTPSPLPDYFNPGDRVTFRCKTGYILNEVSVITCQDDGQWTSSVPTCTAVSCGSPPSFPNAYHTNTEYTYPNIVYYHCNDGYYHSGGGTPYKQCLDSATWSVGIEPQCTDNNMAMYIGIGVAAFVTMTIIILILISLMRCQRNRSKTSRDHELVEVGENTHGTSHRNIDVTEGCADADHGPGMNEFASDDTADYDVIDKNYKKNITPTIAVIEPFSRDINVTDDWKPATGVQKQRDPGIEEINNMEAEATLANMYACVNKPKTRLTRNRNVEVESVSAYDDVQIEQLIPIRLSVDFTVNPRPTSMEVSRVGDEIPTTQVSDMYAFVEKRNSARSRTMPTDRPVDAESVDDDNKVPVVPPRRMSLVESEGNNQQEGFVENDIYQSTGESDVDDAALSSPIPLKDGNRGARTTEKTAGDYEGFIECAVYQSAGGADDYENNSQPQEGFVDNAMYESM
uniref:Uncharacterized protein LOC102804144 n=1 Tax=Saccoglossus kowalevskii TaxID=10224 RepID=A0ABM0LUF1_SACKO